MIILLFWQEFFMFTVLLPNIHFQILNPLIQWQKIDQSE